MPSYTIHLTDRTGATNEYELQAPVITLGRKKQDITLDDPAVSSKHAELRFDGAVLSFADVGSSNGSFLATGQRITEVTLAVGSVVKFGGCTINVIAIDAVQEQEERTSMLTEAQLRQVLGQQAAAQAQAAAPAPARSAPDRKSVV